MSIKNTIREDLKNAMRQGDAKKRDVLRMIDSSIKNTEIEKRKREEGLNDEEVIEVIARAIKQRKDSATQYREGGREELAQNEEEEINILIAYMPEQLGEEEVKETVKGIIQELGATSKSDMGKVMGASMTKLKGKADGNLVKQIVESLL